MTLLRATARALVLVLLCAGAAPAWDDVTGDRDMPWLGSGGRAHWFHDRSSCLMCPTGYTDNQRWGRSRWSGEEPYTTVGGAMRFLRSVHVLDELPEAFNGGSVGDGSGEIIRIRAAPYRFTVVMLEPTVVVMRYDLGALVGLPGPKMEQYVGTPRLSQPVEYGTHFPASGTLLWFSPEAAQAPTAVPLSAPDRGEIVVKGTRLVFTRQGDAWAVTQP